MKVNTTIILFCVIILYILQCIFRDIIPCELHNQHLDKEYDYHLKNEEPEISEENETMKLFVLILHNNDENKTIIS